MSQLRDDVIHQIAECRLFGMLEETEAAPRYRFRICRGDPVPPVVAEHEHLWRISKGSRVGVVALARAVVYLVSPAYFLAHGSALKLHDPADAIDALRAFSQQIDPRVANASQLAKAKWFLDRADKAILRLLARPRQQREGMANQRDSGPDANVMNARWSELRAAARALEG